MKTLFTILTLTMTTFAFASDIYPTTLDFGTMNCNWERQVKTKDGYVKGGSERLTRDLFISIYKKRISVSGSDSRDPIKQKYSTDYNFSKNSLNIKFKTDYRGLKFKLFTFLEKEYTEVASFVENITLTRNKMVVVTGYANKDLVTGEKKVSRTFMTCDLRNSLDLKWLQETIKID